MQTCVAADGYGKSFFCQPSGEMTTLARASHLSKAFQCVQDAFTHSEISMVLEGALHDACMFERGNLINLMPVINTHSKPCNLSCNFMNRDLVAELSLLTSVRFIISFLRELCQFAFCIQLGSINACNNNTHTKKKKQTWPSLPELCSLKKHCFYCFCMILVLSLYG